MCSAIVSLAQKPDQVIVDRAIKNLQSKWEGNLIFSTASDSANTRLLHTLLSYPVEHVNSSSAQQEELDILYQNLYRKDIGLTGTMGYLENLDPAPDDDNLFYFRRLQAGLNWNILKDGYLSHQYKAKALRYENLIEQKVESSSQKKADYLSRWHSIMFMFNQVKVDILKQRQNVVNTQLEYAREFYRLKLLKREDLLSIEARMAENKAMFGIYASYNDQLSPDFPTVVSYSDNIPVFDLKMDILLKDFQSLAGDSIKNLTADYLKYKTSVIHDIRVSTFFRYNWYDIVSAGTGNRSFFSLGINASVPIPFNNKLKKEIVKKEFELNQFKGSEERSEVQKDLINAAYEYRYKLKQYINFYEKRIRFMELLRQENVLLKLDPLDFNPVKALGLIDDILKIDLELTDLNQNMYLKALKIYAAIPYVKSRDLFEPFFMPNFDDKENHIERSTYLWSSGIRSYSNAFINEYSKYNQIDALMLSVNLDKELDSARTTLITELNTSNIDVHLMIGRNKLMQEGDMSGYLDRLTENRDTNEYKGIHLDIEPHTFEDYKDKKASYLQTYTDLVSDAQAWCLENKKELSISIPLHYPQTTITELYGLVDKIYFMCYENVKDTYLTRKLLEMGNPNKTVIALRTNDFSNRLQMERLFETLSKKTGINSFCLHDFSSVFELDAETIKGGAKESSPNTNDLKSLEDK